MAGIRDFLPAQEIPAKRVQPLPQKIKKNCIRNHLILKSTKIKKKRQEVVLKRKQKSRVKGGQGAVSWEDGALRWGWGESCTKAAEAFLQGSRVVGFSEALMLGNTGGELRNVSCQHRGGQLISSVLAKNKQTKTVLWGFKFFLLLFLGFFCFCFFKRKIQ